MASESLVELTLVFNDPGLNAEEKDEEVQNLLNQMKQMEEVEQSDRVLDLNPPKGNKALGGFLVGMLTVAVQSENIKTLFNFFSERLKGKPLEMALKAPSRYSRQLL